MSSDWPMSALAHYGLKSDIVRGPKSAHKQTLAPQQIPRAVQFTDHAPAGKRAS